MKPYWILFLCFLLSCSGEKEPDLRKYIFLSHTYEWSSLENNKIDYRLKDYDFSPYDQIWLGGDLCARTNEDTATLQYLDSIFSLSAPTTHWALGNHDIGHGPLERIEHITQRKTYSNHWVGGLNLFVMNTTEFSHENYQPKPHECALLDGQLNLLQQVVDTMEHASHLIILHHHILLTKAMTQDSLALDKIFNIYNEGLKVSCEGPFTFENKIYPMLQKVQQKGIQVILVSGDLGQRSKSFEYQTDDGIWFLASGINNSAKGEFVAEWVTDFSPDKALIFEHDVAKGKLSWHFKPLFK